MSTEAVDDPGCRTSVFFINEEDTGSLVGTADEKLAGDAVSISGYSICSSPLVLGPEKEGRDAIRWLRLAGFPQYAQMYYDGAFPIDLSLLNIERDHDFLDIASLDVLIRRLEVLNMCAEIGLALGDKEEMSDYEELRAISDSWRFVSKSGTWKRRERERRAKILANADEHEKEESEEGNVSAEREASDKTSRPPADDGEEPAANNNAAEDKTSPLGKSGRSGLRRSRRVSQRPYHYSQCKNREANLSDNEQVQDNLSCPRKRIIRPTVRPKAPLPSAMQRTSMGNSDPDAIFSASDDDNSSLSDSLEEDSDSERNDVQWTSRSERVCTHISRVRWHSLLDTCPVKPPSDAIAISELSVSQIDVLHKLSLLKLTSLLELSSKALGSEGFKPTKAISRLVKHFKTQDYKGKNVFGVPLHVTMQRTGQPLPQCILYALQYLQKNALNVVGLFRKAGSRNRVNQLKANNEENDASGVDYSGVSPHDVADMVKHYFRELPEPLFTSKMSESLLLIGAFVPETLRMSSLQSAMILMPDENREVIYTLLFFLRAVAEKSSVNSMTSHNLAVCWAPTLFALSSQQQIQSSSLAPQGSPTMTRKIRTKKKPSSPKEKDFDECSSAQIVLEMLIDNCEECMQVPMDTLRAHQFTPLENGEPGFLADIGNSTDCLGGCSDFLENCLQSLLKEHNGGYRGWVQHSCVDCCDISYKKIRDGLPLWLWRGVIEVPAAADFVLERILRERHRWDEDIIQWRVIEKISENAEVFNYIMHSMVPHKKREFVVLRSWHRRESMIAVMATSIKHPLVKNQGGTEAMELATRYILESTNMSTTRVTFILRHDLRGRSAEFYNRSYGPYCAASLCRLRQSFLIPISGTSF